jgi:GntR family transcriptional regulator
MAFSDSLTARTTDRLRAMIRAGDFAEGRLAPEPAVAKRLGVSRATVRQALAQLAHEGVIVRKHGSGTFVNRNVLHITTRLEEVWDFAEMIRLSGHTPGVRPLGTELRPAPPECQAPLGLAAGAEVLAVTNLFLADERPVIYCRDIIPGHMVRQAYQWDELHGPVFEFLARRCGQTVSYAITEVLAVTAGPALARVLACKRATPLHRFDEVAYNAQHEPILYSQEFYVPDAFRFQVVRKLTTGAATAAPAPATRASRPRGRALRQQGGS